ncbi:MAG: L-threonylcarbamoyladenylate synthase [Bacteroidota bacterium]
MLIKLYEENPNPKQIKSIIECLKDGGIIIYPTDTIYGMGCDIFKQKTVERIAQIKGVKSKKSNFSIICHDLSHISDYTKPFETSIYKILKKLTPGPFTFILNANNNIPKLFQNNKKTIGIRVPSNEIVLEIVRELGNPILTTSIIDEDDILEYTTDPELIYEKYCDLVDIVIDGGYGGNVPSTVVDCTDAENIQLIRQGKGDFSEFL